MTNITFPNPSASGRAGVVFGYKSSSDYWIQVLDIAAQKERVYHVVSGSASLIEEDDFTIVAGTPVNFYALSKRGAFAGASGYPSGKYGLYSNITGVKFDTFRIFNDAEMVSLLGRWDNNMGLDGTNAVDTSTDRFKVMVDDISKRSPAYLKNMRTKRYEVTFNIKRESLGTNNNIAFCFNGTDQDDYDYLRIYHKDTKTAPFGYKYDDGVYSTVSGTRTSSNMPTLTSSDTLWVRVTCNGTSVTVKCATSEGGLGSASNCFSSSFTISGGMIGFMNDNTDGSSIDELTVKADRDSNGSYETTEHYDGYTANGSGQGEETLTYDAAGNITWDGVQKYTYDAWNRLTKITKAYRNSGGTLTDGSVISEMEYDGQGRRIIKQVKNSGDLDATYRYWHDGESIIEIRNGSDQVLKQQVWSIQYIDALCQISLNDDPADGGEQNCETNYWAMYDSNYNVLGIADSSGVLKERYEYSPYGKRTTFFSPGTNDTLLMAPTPNSRRWKVSSVNQPYGICEFGHQGLHHDEEAGLGYNRARMLHTALGRFLQRDPLQYVDGMSLYEYLGNSTIGLVDPQGTSRGSIGRPGHKEYANKLGPFKNLYKMFKNPGKKCHPGMRCSEVSANLTKNALAYVVRLAAYKIYNDGDEGHAQQIRTILNSRSQF